MENGLVTGDSIMVFAVSEYDRFVNFIFKTFRSIFIINQIAGLKYQFQARRLLQD